MSRKQNSVCSLSLSEFCNDVIRCTLVGSERGSVRNGLSVCSLWTSPSYLLALLIHWILTSHLCWNMASWGWRDGSAFMSTGSCYQRTSGSIPKAHMIAHNCKSSSRFPDTHIQICIQAKHQCTYISKNMASLYAFSDGSYQRTMLL